MTDYLGPTLSGFAGGLLALAGGIGTLVFKERFDKKREERAAKRKRHEAQHARLRAAYRTTILAVRSLQEIVTSQAIQKIPQLRLTDDQLRERIRDLGGPAILELRRAAIDLVLEGEPTDLLDEAVSAYTVMQISIAFPDSSSQSQSNEHLQRLNAAYEALRIRSRERLAELEADDLAG